MRLTDEGLSAIMELRCMQMNNTWENIGIQIQLQDDVEYQELNTPVSAAFQAMHNKC